MHPNIQRILTSEADAIKAASERYIRIASRIIEVSGTLERVADAFPSFQFSASGAYGDDDPLHINFYLSKPYSWQEGYVEGETDAQWQARCAQFIRGVTRIVGVPGVKSKPDESARALSVTWTLPRLVIEASNYKPETCQEVEEVIERPVEGAYTNEAGVLVQKITRTRLVCSEGA